MHIKLIKHETAIINHHTIFYNGNACPKRGIGTPTPQAKLHVADGPVVFTGLAGIPESSAITPLSGAGTRMMWYLTKQLSEQAVRMVCNGTKTVSEQQINDLKKMVEQLAKK